MKACKICFRSIDEGVNLREYLFYDDIICGNCRHKFIENKKTYSYHNLRITAFYLYDDFLESLLFQYKEARDIALADVFLWKKKEEVFDIFRHSTCILMPSSEQKIKERGFHHLERMLECCHVEPISCFEKKDGYKQSTQRASERGKIKEVIKLKYPIEKDFILFDDVITSGNTLLSAASLLKDSNQIVKAVALSVHPLFVELCEKERL